MNAKKLLLSILLISSTQVLMGADDEYKTLTAKDGRQIVAKLVNVNQGQIRIKREDGSQFNVTPEMFAEEDAKYLQHWAVDFLMENDRFLSFNARYNRDQRGALSETKRDLPTFKDNDLTQRARSAGPHRGMPNHARMSPDYNLEGFGVSDYGYRVEIENESGMLMQGLVIKYTAAGKEEYYINESVPQPDGSIDEYKRYYHADFSAAGTFSRVSVPAHGKVMLLTKPLSSTDAIRPTFDARGMKGYKFDFTGIRLEIYLDNKLLFTYAEPSNYGQPSKYKSVADEMDLFR